MLIQVCSPQHHAVLNSPSTSSQAIKPDKSFFMEHGQLVDGTAHASWQNEAARYRVVQCHASGVLLRIGALLVLLAVIFFGPFSGEARAHGLHAGLTVQIAEGLAESTVSRDEAEVASEQNGCGLSCCSATGCSAAVLNAAHPCFVVVAIDGRFALPDNTAAKPSPQSTLKRPPRA